VASSRATAGHRIPRLSVYFQVRVSRKPGCGRAGANRMCAESLRNACTMKEPIRDNKNITNGMYAVQNIGSMTHRLLFSNTVVRCDPFEAPRLTGSPMTYDQIRKHALSVLLQSFSRCCNRSRNLSGRAQNSQNKRPPEGSLSRTLRGEFRPANGGRRACSRSAAEPAPTVQ
jgi:hypothetical protein